jgi:5-methylcytosine-specific restriction enzyme A
LVFLKLAAMGHCAHLYQTQRRRKMRADLREHPCCLICLEHGWDVRATVIDHRRPHRGDSGLSFDPRNLDGLCKPQR